MEDNNTNGFAVPTYVINLKERKDRLDSIIGQFENRPEFSLNIIEAERHPIGAVGLWNSILKIIKLAINNDDDVIIICEDDHEFTEDYSANFLIQNIIEANRYNAELLTSGIGSYGYAVPISENLFWISPFQSTQFLVLYSSIFEKILSYKFKKSDVADLVLSTLTSHKMVLFPFISKQKDFGYSDITDLHNQDPSVIKNMFLRTQRRLESMQGAFNLYRI